MSRALARAKLHDAQSALACLRSNLEAAAEQLDDGHDDFAVAAAGLALFVLGAEEMQAAIRRLLADMDRDGQSERLARALVGAHKEFSEEFPPDGEGVQDA